MLHEIAEPSGLNLPGTENGSNVDLVLSESMFEN